MRAQYSTNNTDTDGKVFLVQDWGHIILQTRQKAWYFTNKTDGTIFYREFFKQDRGKVFYKRNRGQSILQTRLRPQYFTDKTAVTVFIKQGRGHNILQYFADKTECTVLCRLYC